MHVTHSPSFVPIPLSLFALVGAASLAAQSPIAFAPGEVTKIAARAPGAGYRNAVAGHFRGYHANDAVVLADGKALMLTAPGVFRISESLPVTVAPVGFSSGDVRDIAVLTNHDRNGTDKLIMVTGAGLWEWASTQSGQWPQGTWGYTVSPLGNSVWAGASQLRVADVDGDGAQEILGTMANGSTLRCFQPDGGSPWALPTGARIHDFQIADIVPGGAPEIVVFSGPVVVNQTVTFAGGIRVYDSATRALVSQAELPNTGGVCAVLPTTAGNAIVVAFETGGTYPMLAFHYVPSVGLALADAMSLSSSPRALVAAAWRHAAADLLLTMQGAADPHEVCYQAGLGFTSLQPIALGGAATADNQAVPLVADFHGDPAATENRGSRARLLYPIEATGEIAVQHEIAFPAGFPTWVPRDGGGGWLSGRPASGTPEQLEMQYWTMDTATDALNPASGGYLSRDLLWTAVGDRAQLQIPSSAFGNQVYMVVMRFTADAGATRWPIRAAIVADFEGHGTAIMSYLATVFGTAYTQGGLPPVVALPFSSEGPENLMGITGDVVQPPAGSGGGTAPPARP